MSPRVLRSLVTLSALLTVMTAASAQDAVLPARALMASWHEDRARIERARRRRRRSWSCPAPGF